MDNKDDVNKKLPSGYYLKGDNIIKGCDTLIRDCSGSVTKLPPVIIATTSSGSTIQYKSNAKEGTINGFQSIHNFYTKIIEKKEYSYKFSDFYYIEGESAPTSVPTKLLLHSVNDNGYEYDWYKYNKIYKKMIKTISNNFFNTNLINFSSYFYQIKTIIKNYLDNRPNDIDRLIIIKNSNNTLLFNEINKSIITKFKDNYKVIVTVGIGSDVKETGQIRICFVFDDTNIIKENIKFENANTGFNYNDFFKISIDYYKEVKNIDNFKSTEPYQYGVYRLKNTKNYIALKFDINDALPTFIKNLYTKEPCNKDIMEASILKDISGQESGPKNIITPEETLTEIYVIKSY